MPAGLRLLAAASRQSSGGKLTGIDALMGCPLALPDVSLFIDRWAVKLEGCGTSPPCR